MTFSEIVDKIQGDKRKGAELLIFLSREQIKAKKEVDKLEIAMNKAQNSYQSTVVGIERIFKHLKLKTPFLVKKEDAYYQITSQFEANELFIDYEYQEINECDEEY